MISKINLIFPEIFIIAACMYGLEKKIGTVNFAKRGNFSMFFFPL